MEREQEQAPTNEATTLSNRFLQMKREVAGVLIPMAQAGAPPLLAIMAYNAHNSGKPEVVIELGVIAVTTMTMVNAINIYLDRERVQQLQAENEQLREQLPQANQDS